MTDGIREVREARRAIDGAAGRKARKLRNRDLQRELRGKGLAEHKLAADHAEVAAARRDGVVPAEEPVAEIDTVEVYRWSDGHTMRREHGVCPVGNPIRGSWVLRDADGAFVDYDRYRNDIIPRHGLADIEPTLVSE